MTGVNAAGLRAVVCFLAFFPERWDQTVVSGWHRGLPTYCFAALTCWLAGLNVAALLAGDRTNGAPAGDSVYTAAAGMLGLSDGQAARIFRFTRTESGAHPTLQDFCQRITASTGVDFDPARIL